MAPTLPGYIRELEAALGREWSAADMRRTMNRVQGVFKNVGAATATATNDALSDQVRDEMVHLKTEQNAAVSEILLKYFKMILEAMPATEVDPPVVDFEADMDMDLDIDTDINYLSEEEDEDELDTICVVCQEDLYAGEDIIVTSSLQCGHKFHKDCITEWLRRGSKFCPLCKAVVP